MKSFVRPNAYVTLTAVAIAGCASSPPASVALARSPEQVVRSLSSLKLSARAEPDPVFGLAQLKALLEPATDGCQADGGTLVVLSRSEIDFTAKPNNLGAQRTRRLLPTKLACRSSQGLLWGATLEYADTLFFPSQWSGETYFYATTRTAFLSGASLDLSEPTGSVNRAVERKLSEECSSRRAAYTQRLRIDPKVGMEVAFGTIVELRPPLAHIQYNALGRQVKQLEAEWLPIDSLSAGTNCPN